MRQPGFYNMQEAAKVLNIKKFGRNKLMQFLKEEQILMPNNCPGVQYVLDGYFSFYHKPIRGFENRVMRIAYVPLVSDLGIEFLKNLIVQQNYV